MDLFFSTFLCMMRRARVNMQGTDTDECCTSIEFRLQVTEKSMLILRSSSASASLNFVGMDVSLCAGR